MAVLYLLLAGAPDAPGATTRSGHDEGDTP
jgi:hypothetical protein